MLLPGYEEGRANPRVLSSVASLAHVNGAPLEDDCGAEALSSAYYRRPASTDD